MFFPMQIWDKDAQLAGWRVREGPAFDLLKSYASADVHLCYGRGHDITRTGDSVTRRGYDE